MEDSDASHRESRRPAWPVLTRAALAGLALGVVVFAAGSLILYEASGVLAAAGGLVATFAAALAAGLWAGSPGVRADQAPTWRWVGAGVAVAVAGGFGTLWAFYGWERFGGAGRAFALLFLVGVPVYALGFLLPALVAWGGGYHAVGDDDERRDEARRRGAEETVLAVLAGAAVGAALSGLALLPALSPGLLLMALGAALTFPLFFPRDGSAAPESDEHLVHEEETPYGTVRVTEIVHPGGKRQPELRLYVDEEIESGELERSGAPTFAYVATAERWLRDVTQDGASYLFLGGGAYTLPRRIAEDDPGARITVVELDPAVTRAAYRFFGLRSEHGIVTLHGDARAVSQALRPGEWDRVVVDVFGGGEQVPHHLVTAEALALFRALLRPGGVALLNLIGVARGEGECRFWSVARTVAAAFPAVRLYVHVGRDFPERQNFLMAASDDPAFAFPPSAGRFEAWPVDEWPALPCAGVLRDRVDGAQTQAAPPAAGGGRGERAVSASGD
ncbi:fused MFS/spermidine synthase [Longimicrobium sp.]|uniref:fused MFS/spermidine synthase n=1 Tax=Longimicrobium sp. TaxID=2029185 RepID=UPI002E2F7FDC|nr:fused MFS/spermidine synthase [Longimicrobium sp.]HEX6039249.1 fused MFS/spermidine synthase [Longimicrobium sp.]